ncbi:hypothetical protein RRG08_011926 [Elysia crispata]|uniref:Uncharacterized protein n=1 Tax=Elysia crispata TaxID=231223 RepID=A0AAE0XVB9_9GAST|nr:hypothetical protein RRG08_011926 [Elysia crispata]
METPAAKKDASLPARTLSPLAPPSRHSPPPSKRWAGASFNNFTIHTGLALSSLIAFNEIRINLENWDSNPNP